VDLRQALKAALEADEEIHWAGDNAARRAEAEEYAERKWKELEKVLIDTVSKAGPKR